MAKLLGKIECNEANEEEKELLRFLTPLIKLYTAKQVSYTHISRLSHRLRLMPKMIITENRASGLMGKTASYFHIQQYFTS